MNRSDESVDVMLTMHPDSDLRLTVVVDEWSTLMVLENLLESVMIGSCLKVENLDDSSMIGSSSDSVQAPECLTHSWVQLDDQQRGVADLSFVLDDPLLR